MLRRDCLTYHPISDSFPRGFRRYVPLEINWNGTGNTIDSADRTGNSGVGVEYSDNSSRPFLSAGCYILRDRPNSSSKQSTEYRGPGLQRKTCRIEKPARCQCTSRHELLGFFPVLWKPRIAPHDQHFSVIGKRVGPGPDIRERNAKRTAA